MPFDNIISRTDADALIPVEEAEQVIHAATQESAVMALSRIARMSSKVLRQPVLSAMPIAYFVNSDTGLKQTTEGAWTGVELQAEELACIVPAPEAVLDDAAFDVWAELRPTIGQAFAAKIDAAILTGTDKPSTWPQAIVPAATAAGNVATAGTATVPEGGIYGDLAELLSLIETDGFEPTGYAAQRGLRSYLRGARDANGQPLAQLSTSSAWDLPIQYAVAGSLAALAVAGAWDMSVFAIRQDLTWKILDQAVITDNTGKVIFNLPQQDMLAMRVVGRFAWAVGVPVTLRDGVSGGTAYPFSVLNPAAAP